LECQEGVYENRRQGLMANGNTSNKTDTVAEGVLGNLSQFHTLFLRCL